MAFIRLWPLLLALAIASFLAAPAQARNVPGSASITQTRIDQANTASIIDMTLRAIRIDGPSVMTMIDAVAAADSLAGATPTIDSLSAYTALSGFNGATTLGEVDSDTRFSVGFGAGYLFGDVDGYDFDYLSAYGSAILSHEVTSSLTLLAALIAEGGQGDLKYNNGTLEHSGLGILGGVIIQLNDTLDLSLVGGIEGLQYGTTRDGGLFTGDYAALRYLGDAQLRGLYEGGSFFLEYGGGLRFVHQDNDGYTEMTGGVPGSYVSATSTSSLDALANIKFGVPMGTFTPFVQASGGLGLYANTNGVTSSDHNLSGRLGIGVDAMVMAGKLTLDAGFFANDDGVMGVDGGLNFAKSF